MSDKNKIINFPIKGHMLPKHADDNCPICGKDISKGQVIVMMEGSCSIDAHFHEMGIFDGVRLNEQTCDLMFCSTSCVREFFDRAIWALEYKNPKLRNHENKK